MTINAVSRSLAIVPSADTNLYGKYPGGDYPVVTPEDPPFETTFDLGVDWDASVAGAGDTGIPGLSRYLYKSTTAGNWSEIIVAAKRPGSTGARGLRNWLGDGTNIHSGGVKTIFDTPQDELWIRWYMRYQSGFTWTTLNYHKWILVLSGAASNSDFSIAQFITQGGSDKSNVFTAVEGNHASANDKGWDYVNDGATGDGLFHLYECHVKLSTGGAANGVVQLWIDEELLVDDSSVAFGATVETYKFAGVAFGSNAKNPGNGGDAYVDYDDIYISNTGYVGPA